MTKTKTRNRKEQPMYAGEPLRFVHDRTGFGTFADLSKHQREQLGKSYFDNAKQMFDAALSDVNKFHHKLSRALSRLGEAASMLWSGDYRDYAPPDMNVVRRNGKVSHSKAKKVAKR